MGGVFNINLYLHRKDDKQYNKKRRELRKYVPILQAYLSQMVVKGRSLELSYTILSEFLKQVNNSSRRVPIHVLLRGEDLLRREVLNCHEAKSSIVEVVWRSQGFRLAVQKKLEDTIRQYGNDTGRNHETMERRIFDKAKTKEEYLENAAKIIIYLREMNFRENMVTDPWKELNAAKRTACANIEHDLDMYEELQLQQSQKKSLTTKETGNGLCSLHGEGPKKEEQLENASSPPKPMPTKSWAPAPSTITSSEMKANNHLQMVVRLQLGQQDLTGHSRKRRFGGHSRAPGGKCNSKVLPQPPSKVLRLSPTEQIHYKPVEVNARIAGPGPQAAPRAFLRGYSNSALVEMWTIAAQSTPVTQIQLDRIAKGSPSPATGATMKKTCQLLLSLSAGKGTHHLSSGNTGANPETPSPDPKPCCSKTLPPIAHLQRPSLLLRPTPKRIMPESCFNKNIGGPEQPSEDSDLEAKALDLRRYGRKGKGRGKCSGIARKGSLATGEDLSELKKQLALAQTVCPLYGTMPAAGGLTDPNEFVVHRRVSFVNHGATKTREILPVVGTRDPNLRKRIHPGDPQPLNSFNQKLPNTSSCMQYKSQSIAAIELDSGTKKMLQNVLHSRTRSPFRESNINCILDLGITSKERLRAESMRRTPYLYRSSSPCMRRVLRQDRKGNYAPPLIPKVQDLSSHREDTLPMCSTTSSSGKGMPISNFGGNAPLTPPDSPPPSLYKG